MTIRMKVIVATAAIAALIGLFAGASLLEAGSARAQMAKLAVYDERRAVVQDLRLQTAMIWQFLTDASLTRNRESIDQGGKSAQEQAGKDIDRLLSLEVGDKARTSIQDFKGILQGFWDAGVGMFDAYGESKKRGNAAMEDFDLAGQKMLDSFQDLIDPILASRQATERAFESRLSSNFILTLALGLAVVVLAALGGLAFASRLSRPIVAAAASIKALASRTGDLTVRLDAGGRDETGDLARSFNAFAETLRGILVSVAALVDRNRKLGEHLSAASRVAAESVADMNGRISAMRDGIGRLDSDIIGSSAFIEEIMASINNLTIQVEAQFKAIERSSASIEEIMASVGNVARIAESRTEGMRGLAELIRDGGHKVAATKAVILEISRSADEMLGMVDIIDSIASRTNLLAMNASIEAAHAGAAGKGFAVVAGEIRNLAVTTAANASAIAKSLKATNEKVAKASASGEESEKAFLVIDREVTEFSKALGEVTGSMRELSQASAEILDSINTLVDTSGTVKAASTDMRDGSSEILRSIHDIRDVSASTLAGTEELAELASTLSAVSLKVAAFGNQNLYNSSVLAAEVAKLDTGAVDAAEPLQGADEEDYGMAWSDILSVGVQEMDDQHKELFKRISALLQGMLSGSGGADVQQLLSFIGDYVERHFMDEERLMRERGFPRLEGHRQLHAAFKEEFVSIAARIRSEGLGASLLILLQDRVINWLVDHIGKVDKQYGAFIRDGSGNGG